MSSFLPTVRYHTTVYIEENQRMFENSVGTFKVENVVKVINGTIESILHLIGYSFPQIRQINRQFGRKYDFNQKIEFDLSLSENRISEELKNQRPTRAHVVEHENRLYGVIVDKGRAQICGQISRVIPKTKSDNNCSVLSRGIKVNRSEPNGVHLNDEQELRMSSVRGQNFVIVSEKGAVFVVPNDIPNYGHNYENKLTLVLGHGFVVLNEPIVRWIRSKQELRDQRRESIQLLANESIIASFAAICVAPNYIKVCGTGSVVNIRNIKEFYACLSD